MNQEIKARWVSALRSGEYTQGQGALRTRNGQYCCLGVLCDLAAKEGIGVWETITSQVDSAVQDYFISTQDASDLESATLPEAVWSWAGLKDDNPTLDEELVDADGESYIDHESAAERNDGGASFTEIADLIERNL